MLRRPSAVLLNDTRVDRHHGCQRVVNAIHVLLEKSSINLVASSPAHADWSTDGPLVAAMERVQLIVVNGEGTIHHDSPAGRRLLQAGAFARSRGIPAALINCGWEANGPDMAAMLDDFALVAFRDRQSATVMKGRSCHVVPDLSMYPAGNVPKRARTNLLGFTDSVDRFKALELDRSRRQACGRTISILCAGEGATGYLRFIRDGVSLSEDVWSPLLFSRVLMMRHRLWRASSASTLTLLAQMAGLRLLVSGRFHACTLAIVTETPFVGLPSNTGKIGALISDAGLGLWRGETTLEPTDLIEAANRGWSTEEVHALREYRCEAQSRAESLFRDMRAML